MERAIDGLSRRAAARALAQAAEAGSRRARR
jgi:hypothetical protein